MRPLVGVFVNGFQNSLIGCTIETSPDNSATAKEIIGVYIRDSNWYSMRSPTLISGCYFENWKNTFLFDGCEGVSVVGCWSGQSTSDFVKYYNYGATRSNNFIGHNANTTVVNSYMGSVGIGVVSPLKLLHLQKATGNNTYDDILVIDSKDGGAGNGGGIAFHNNESHVLARIKAIDADSWAGRLDFTVSKATGDDQITAMTILGPSGSVGIGQTSPTGQLEVKQPSSTGAKPVLVLDQQDTDQHFIEFKTATVYTGKTAADEYLKVKTASGDRYIRLYS